MSPGVTDQIPAHAKVDERRSTQSIRAQNDDGAAPAAAGAVHGDARAWQGKTLALAVYPPSKRQIGGTGGEFIIGSTSGVVEPRNAAGAKLRAYNATEDSALRCREESVPSCAPVRCYAGVALANRAL